MTNLLERAISTGDADRAAKIIQDALERRRCQLLLPKELAQRP
jgi:hypothetical protein